MRRIGRWLIMVLICAVALEAAARLDDWIRYRANAIRYYGPKDLRWVDDTGLSFNRPGIRYEKWRHDAQGFRAYDLPAGVTGDGIRWVCLGTSESYGLYESPNHEWPAQLGALVAGQGIRVDNASVVGQSPVQYGRYLERYVLPHNPDLVILLVNPAAYVQGLVKGAEPDSAAFADPQRLARMRRSCTPRGLENSRFLPKVRASILRRLPAGIPQSVAIAKKQRDLDRLLRARGGEPLLDGPAPELVTGYVDLLARLTRGLRSRGVEVAVCAYATSSRTEPSRSARDAMLDRRLLLPAYSARGIVEISRRCAAAARDFCDSTGTCLVDLDAALPKDDATFADSVHLTDAGAALAAAAAYTALAASRGDGLR